MLATSLVSIDSLIKDKKNARKHGVKNLKAIEESFKRFGQVEPLVVRKADIRVLGGNGRLDVMTKLGYKEVSVHYVDISEKEADALAITLNRSGELAEWDKDVLSALLKDLSDDFDLGDLGFEDDELEEFGVTEKPTVSEKDDEIPEIEQNKFGVKLGDIWQLGDHRLMCGDSTVRENVERLMDGQKADMVFTDPPYGYKYESNHQSKHKMLENDDQILNFMPVAYAAMENNSCIYVCGSHQTIEIWKPLFGNHFSYKNLIVWKKNNWSMGDLKGSFAGQHELILFGHKGKVELVGKRDTDIWEFNREPPKDHPTQKPVDLISFAISKVISNRVLDLFLGSGSTLIACEKTGRKCFASELDPHYVSVAIERWQKLTGKKAVRVEEGM